MELGHGGGPLMGKIMLDMQRGAGLMDGSQDTGSRLGLAPMPSGRLARWHCVATNYGQQFLAEATLSVDWPVFFPLHLDRKSGRVDRIDPLFPGYGFVSFDSSHDDWPRICRARGVYKLLGDIGRPRALPVGLIEGLLERTSPRRIVDDPGVVRGVVYLSAGARGRVVEGPFAGWEGLCTLSGPGRVRLLLEMFGSRREVEFKAALVTEA